MLKIEVKQIILGLEKKLMNTQVRQSAAKISELLTDDFFEFCSSGNIYIFKSGDIFNVASEELNVKYSISEFKVEILSEKVILATYTLLRIEKDKKEYSLRSSIWKNTEGSWKMYFHQGTKLK